MKQKIFITTIFFISLLFAHPYTITAVESTFSPGGTDYTIYDSGDGIHYPQMTLEYPASVKSVIGSYNLHPDVVRNQLQSMCNTGQRKISLIVYFFPFLPEWGMVQDGVYDQHKLSYINSAGGKLSPRHTQNVKDVVSLIANLKTNQNIPCFSELQFRFAPMGIAQPLGWNTWDEVRYQENWNFIYNTRNLIKSAIGTAPLAVYFDLGAEQGGQVVGPAGGVQNVPYLKKLWVDYNATFGITDTYGFSIAWTSGRFKQLIVTYDQVGLRPAHHAVDIYDESNQGMGPQLQILFSEMQQTGEQNKPVIIQETYYNDIQAYDQILAAKNQLGIKIRTIMQWQMQRGNLNNWTLGSSYPHLNTQPSGTISCNPSEMLLQPGTTGTATINSTTTNLGIGNWAQVCVSTNGGAMQEMATFNNGSNQVSAPWITGGKSYLFNLYSITPGAICTGAVLANCNVHGTLVTTPTPTPTPIPGDYDGDRDVDLADFDEWERRYLAVPPTMTLVEFGVWKTAYLGN